MFKATKMTRVAAALALSMGAVTAAQATETSSEVRGLITGPQGNPAANTTVTITHVPTGTQRTVNTGANGQFNAKGLRVGGPYTIELDSPRFKDAEVSDVYLTLGSPLDFNYALAADNAIETIVVTASQVDSLGFGQNGPGASFSLETLETAPAINRNITDIIRIDPRMYVNEARGDINEVQCAGKNSRFNRLTVDGVQLNDAFGLNSNGYPTERMPFSYDAVEQVSVELAPFDVVYGGFTGCNINAVTKSGTNEFHGSAFYDYTSNDLRGDSLEGDDIVSGDYDESRYGFTIGGPILKDQLFFFASYEALEGVNLFTRGAEGSGAINEVPITQAELDEIAQIAKDVYFYDPGTIPTSLDNEDEKLLVKIDWNINEMHRLSLTYNYNDGNNFTQSDGGFDEIEFDKHLYERGAELESYVASLYSDWSDKFSTEVRLSYLELDNRQVSVENTAGILGGSTFGEMQINTDDVTVYIGGDDSRQANKLKYDVSGIILRGYYYFDNGHSLTFGYERESLDIFNVFVQHTETEVRFNSIEDFRNGNASRVYYNNAPSHNPADAAAAFSYDVNTVYIQDEYAVTPRLTMTTGFRYDWYTSDDLPAENADFVADYGFSNAQNLDGEGLLQPRVGFSYELDMATELRGGLGLYSGGNPNVWISNAYSNTSVLQFGSDIRNLNLFGADVTYKDIEEGAPAGAGPGYGIPNVLHDQVSSGTGSNFEINYVDPDFKIPSEFKLALGVTHTTVDDYVLTADLLVSLSNSQAVVKRADLRQAGTTDSGYPIYESVLEPAFVLTNSTETSTSYILSFGAQKAWDNGLTAFAGYAYSDAEDVQPMTSSVAFSNYSNRTFFDPQEDVSSTSNYNIRHRFTTSLSYTQEFIDGYETTISTFGVVQSGQPYSFAFNGTVDPYNFQPYLDFKNNVLEPGVERNSEEGAWWVKADVAVTQELPGFRAQDSAQAFITIDNFTNFLNDEWGILRQANFPYGVSRDAAIKEGRVGDASLWQITVGVSYQF